MISSSSLLLCPFTRSCKSQPMHLYFSWVTNYILIITRSFNTFKDQQGTTNEERHKIFLTNFYVETYGIHFALIWTSLCRQAHISSLKKLNVHLFASLFIHVWRLYKNIVIVNREWPHWWFALDSEIEYDKWGVVVRRGHENYSNSIRRRDDENTLERIGELFARKKMRSLSRRKVYIMLLSVWLSKRTPICIGGE